jgi:hypothetical protein
VVECFLRAGTALALIFCAMATASPGAAIGKVPPPSIEGQLSEYRRVVLVSFKAFNLVFRRCMPQTRDSSPNNMTVRAEMQQLIASKDTSETTCVTFCGRAASRSSLSTTFLRLTAPNGSPISIEETATHVIQHHPRRAGDIIANPRETA